MKYLDRPLKPEWIYKTLQMVNPNEKPEIYYEPYNNIAVEMVGKDGRRKTRTVLFRTFIYSFQQQTSVIENNPLIELSKQKDIEFMKPILLAKFLIDYDILNYLAKLIHQLFDHTQEIKSSVLTTKMVENFGDLEIVKRSTRAFLKTLTNFKILIEKNNTTFIQLPKRELLPEQVNEILKLYAISLHTNQIDLINLNKQIFCFFQSPDLSAIAHQYQSTTWEYIKGLNRELLILK